MKVRTSVDRRDAGARRRCSALIISSARHGQHRASRRSRWRSSPTSASFQDRSFNQLANKGRITVGKELGIQTRVYVTKIGGGADPEPARRQRERGYNLIFGVGFLIFDRARTRSRRRFPNAAVRGRRPAVRARTRSKPKNATGIVVRRARGRLPRRLPRRPARSKRAGRAADHQRGRREQRAGDREVHQRLHPGREEGEPEDQGAHRTTRTTRPSPTRRSARRRRSARSSRARRSIFQVAGGCGLGALAAAKESGIWGIGVDADQVYLGPHMLTSALKRVDVAVVDLTKLAEGGKLKGGTDFIYNLKNNGVGLGTVEPEGAEGDRRQDATRSASRSARARSRSSRSCKFK